MSQHTACGWGKSQPPSPIRQGCCIQEESQSPTRFFKKSHKQLAIPTFQKCMQQKGWERDAGRGLPATKPRLKRAHQSFTWHVGIEGNRKSHTHHSSCSRLSIQAGCPDMTGGKVVIEFQHHRHCLPRRHKVVVVGVVRRSKSAFSARAGSGRGTQTTWVGRHGGRHVLVSPSLGGR